MKIIETFNIHYYYDTAEFLGTTVIIMMIMMILITSFLPFTYFLKFLLYYILFIIYLHFITYLTNNNIVNITSTILFSFIIHLFIFIYKYK